MKEYRYATTSDGSEYVTRHYTVSAARRESRRRKLSLAILHISPVTRHVRLTEIDPYPGQCGHWLHDGFTGEQHSWAGRRDIANALDELDQQEPL